MFSEPPCTPLPLPGTKLVVAMAQPLSVMLPPIETAALQVLLVLLTWNPDAYCTATVSMLVLPGGGGTLRCVTLHARMIAQLVPFIRSAQLGAVTLRPAGPVLLFPCSDDAPPTDCRAHAALGGRTGLGIPADPGHARRAGGPWPQHGRAGGR